MQDILKNTTATDDETRTIKVGLARMQLAVGNSVAARALVEEVLADDSGNVEAVKLKATWLILDDQTGDAITLLRSAIDQNPRDASLMTLLAQAYERDGNRDLMGEMLSQAVDASGKAPAESIRYAQYLASDSKLVPAEGVLIDALRIAPGNVALLVPLGQIYVAMKDWPRADTVAQQLEAMNEPSAANDLAALRTAILEGQQKNAEASTYLEQLAGNEGANIDAKIAVLRNKLSNGQADDAVTYAAKLVADDPNNLDLQYINASVLAAAGQPAEAEAALKALLAKDPTRAPAWMGLFRLVRQDPARAAEATKILDDALAAVPNSGELRWAKAGVLEASGDIEGAITVYEGLYKENSANPIIANNLASLLSNYRTDADSLKRAEVIARRLRGSNVPAYQDTFGWIAYQNGNFADAVTELEKAAAGLPDDPVVQYHLAMAYLAVDRKTDAQEKFTKLLEAIPADDSRPFVISARSELEKLNAAGIAN
jgi:predicted Zn-dependent protease